MSLAQVVFVTGTDTGVGKTVATAALAAALTASGQSVAVYKPTQAGLEEGSGDIDVVRGLSGLGSVQEGIRLQYPMAPLAAAQREGVALPTLREQRTSIERLATAHDVTLVEGAGGLLVALDEERHTLADIGAEVSAAGLGCGFVVVCRAALGTLNHTALTVEALQRRQAPLLGLVIGAWPADPDQIERTNRIELALIAPILGAIPAGAPRLSPPAFQAAASEWLPGLERQDPRQHAL